MLLPKLHRKDRGKIKSGASTFVKASRSLAGGRPLLGVGKQTPSPVWLCVNVKLALRNQELSQHSFSPHVPSECPCRPLCPQGGAGGYIHVSYMLCRNSLKSIYHKRWLSQTGKKVSLDDDDDDRCQFDVGKSS